MSILEDIFGGLVEYFGQGVAGAYTWVYDLVLGVLNWVWAYIYQFIIWIFNPDTLTNMAAWLFRYISEFVDYLSTTSVAGGTSATQPVLSNWGQRLAAVLADPRCVAPVKIGLWCLNWFVSANVAVGVFLIILAIVPILLINRLALLVYHQFWGSNG